MAPSVPAASSARPDAHGARRMLVVVMIALAMSLIQVSSVNVALESIARSLNVSDSQLQWVLAGYTLAIGVVLVPAGRLGDLFGRSRIFVLGLAAFTLASAACAFAPDGTTLNVLRLVQGAAAGVFSPQVTSIIQRYYSGQARARAFALFGVVISASVAVGPVLAGFLIDLLGPDTGWRSTFFINLPLGLVGVLTAWAWLPHRAERADLEAERADLEARAGRPLSRRERLDIDPVGIVLIVAGVVCLMLPFMSTASWRWWLLPVAVALLAAWVRWERHYEERGNEPMVRLSLFSVRSFSFSTGVMTLQFLGMTSVFVVLATFLQAGLGQAATIAGLVGLPNAIISAVAAMASGRHTIRHGRVIMVGALAAMAVGLALVVLVLHLIGVGASFWWLSAALLLVGIGQGAMGSAAQTQAMLEVPSHAGGIAGGITQTAQRVATAIGNAVITGILFAILAPTGGPQGSDLGQWITAASWSYVTIIAILLVGVVLAVVYVRDARRHPPRLRY